MIKPHRPQKQHVRSCVACRVTGDKRTLIRFVRTAEQGTVCDPTGRLAGRGAYLCNERPCFERARKGHLLDRALRTSLSEADYERLRDDYVAQCDDGAPSDRHSRERDMV
jgi:predicted RNA-binding protein YlxR (DUF448 family)